MDVTAKLDAPEQRGVVVIGYSGHAYVVLDILSLFDRKVVGYCDNEKKVINPFNLRYLGREMEVLAEVGHFDFFVAIGQNDIRERIYLEVSPFFHTSINAIHPKSVIASSVKMGDGVLVAASATINPMVVVGNGVICNTAATIEHECLIEAFVHIAPNAVLCGNVTIGERSFIGANAVIKQGINIGKNVIVGAGSVVLNDLPDNSTVRGNPAR